MKKEIEKNTMVKGMVETWKTGSIEKKLKVLFVQRSSRRRRNFNQVSCSLLRIGQSFCVDVLVMRRTPTGCVCSMYYN